MGQGEWCGGTGVGGVHSREYKLWESMLYRTHSNKAKRKRAQHKKLLVVGITGSYGKTSTKEFLATILSEKFRVLKTKEHQNSEIGISQCILNNLKRIKNVRKIKYKPSSKFSIQIITESTH